MLNRKMTASIITGLLLEYDNINIPTQGEVTWKLDDGNFTWFKFDITEIEYNRSNIY